MAYFPTKASRSHVGYGFGSAESFITGPALVTARVLPLVGLGIFVWEILMFVAKGPKMLMQALSGFWARQRLRAELSALDDRMLSDIGLERGLIDGVVAGRIRRDAKVPATAKATPATAANENAARKSAA
ncbi:DUF1127 domain-containing protein [Zavarzinia sp.]|uniref:DUF1127 domain-containing protein n=1 Tax=Zavarzinia sp. TaxID=2027920 RepID=UPI003567E1C3